MSAIESLSITGWPFLFRFFGGVVCRLFCGFVLRFGCFSFGLTPGWIPDCVMVRAPFCLPNAGCDMHPIVVHHQCPSAEAFRAEVSLTEYETRRDHWNNVITQQMIPKEGRVSHISFEQDKKQSARRYYDLSSTVVDFLPDYTNIITISSQPPSWFFSPKVISLPLRECLREINYCDNSFIQEVFTSATRTSSLKLQTHEFPKYKNHTRWSFFHVALSPEQCFRLKSIHHEREEWKVRFYDELIIRTFERSSLFITLPPGISLSQLIDNNKSCELKEAFTYSDPNQSSFDASTTATGTNEQ